MRSDYVQGMPTWEVSARQHRGGWRRGAVLLVLGLVAAAVLMEPWTREIAAGGLLILGGLLWLVGWALWSRRHPFASAVIADCWAGCPGGGGASARK